MKNESQSSLSQEVDDKIKSLTVDQVEKWVVEDLGRARSFLQAIHNDPNLMRLVAVHLHGLAANHLAAQASKQANAEKMESMPVND